jgi:hypothetical protein
MMRNIVMMVNRRRSAVKDVATAQVRTGAILNAPAWDGAISLSVYSW